ncbi:putative CRIB domain-containing protein [Lupinus albus]|uniref:Putative CRIB domain-containing protein n=1 Tax=Lupinus albus TaxID=3870 RepID=A0A6A4NLP9_LUPAL|nr:putative CRIB domain-containing protein [Lupinus albus]
MIMIMEINKKGMYQFITDNDKEPEIEIGHPTDVKHVAHIGHNSSATWMGGFEPIQELSSQFLDLNRDNHIKESHHSPKQSNEDSSRRGCSSRHVDYEGNERDISRSRRQSTGNMRECQAKEKSDKPRQPKKPSKHHSKDSSSHVSKSIEDVDSFQLQQNNSNNNDLPPKTSRSKLTTKDGSIGGGSASSKSTSTAQTENHTHRSTHSHSRTKQRSFEEDAQIKRGSNENMLTNYPNYPS